MAVCELTGRVLLLTKRYPMSGPTGNGAVALDNVEMDTVPFLDVVEVGKIYVHSALPVSGIELDGDTPGHQLLNAGVNARCSVGVLHVQCATASTEVSVGVVGHGVTTS
jgi:hypothetical protein